MRVTFSLVLVCALLFVAAIVLPPSTASSSNLEAGERWLSSVAKEEGVLALPSGLLYRVDAAGSGASPTRDSRVKVHYAGTLEDGTEFDSSHSRGQPASFGVTQVIKGWTEALLLMKEGDKWTVWIPSQLAYGSRGAGGAIQADAALKFTIELIEVQGGGRKGHADLL